MDEQSPLTQEDRENIRAFLHAFRDDLPQIRVELHVNHPQIDQTPKPTYKEVYTRYKRRHAKNPKVTIREVCEELGVDYDNIRAAKSRATKPKKQKDQRHKRKAE